MGAIKPTPEIYREAARIIEEEGWAKNVYSTTRGAGPGKKCYCMEGAILKSARLRPGPNASIGRGCDLIDYVDAFVFTKTNERYYSAVEFNDDQENSEPVVKMLNDIADALEKEEADS